MSVPEKVLDLVERFDRNIDDYKLGKYSEAEIRLEFIDPFFKALGWDVYNEEGYPDAYKDVIPEYALRIGGATKAPDYCFRIGGRSKFFVEAKKPSINLKDDISPAFQLRRYAWSAKLPLSPLTDFEEFAVYDCQTEPVRTDRATTARISYLTYSEYPERWDEISSVFSRAAVQSGSLNEYSKSTQRKKGTAEVDAAFLKEIESWRELLARNIALRNPALTQRELNFSVQRIIDRIIFLRISEDRGIEPYGRLKNLQDGEDFNKSLVQLFRQADDRYNSGLFHFKPERGRPDESLDTITHTLTIDDAAIKSILKNLYYPESPYEFSVLPADILGHVYEQFLGKVIRLTPSHRAKVEEKPEVKRAGGVYYTPTYIVDYIVEETVGELINGKKPGPRGSASQLKILDPACGSGSFLLGAYQFLLDWYRDRYIEEGPEQHARGRPPRLYKGQSGEWRLTIDEKKRILLSNIYGVDIDPQAVEVTKLSLLLKVLEGESGETLGNQLALWQERALPDLGHNIKCGNSLIEPDYFADQNKFDEEEIRRVNPFDWQAEFPEIMVSGGFDAVIGNPPYVDIKTLPQSDVAYMFSSFETANNRVNLFACFIEKSLRILDKRHGRFSMIIPTAILTQVSYRDLRKHISKHYRVSSVVRLPNESFGSAAGDVKVDTVIIVVSPTSKEKQKVRVIGYEGYNRISQIDPLGAQVNGYVSQSSWLDSDDCIWSINVTDEQAMVLQKCEENSVPLRKCAEFSLGLTPYDKYKGHTPEQIKTQVFHADSPKDATFKKLLAGKDVRRYWLEWSGEKWISYGPWLGAPRQQRFFTERRILVKQIIDWTSKRIWATLTDEELYNTQNAFNLLPRDGRHLDYILGILNSRLMTFYHRKKYLDEFKMRFQKVLIKDCKRFPIRTIDFNNPVDTARHDKMIALVERMLELHRKLSAATIPADKTLYQRQIEAADRKVDAIVYEIYGLTKEEIRILEESMD